MKFVYNKSAKKLSRNFLSLSKKSFLSIFCQEVRLPPHTGAKTVGVQVLRVSRDAGHSLAQLPGLFRHPIQTAKVAVVVHRHGRLFRQMPKKIQFKFCNLIFYSF